MPKAVGLIAALLLAGPAGAAPPAGERPPERVSASPELTQFTGEAEFRRYLKQVRRAARQRQMWWASRPDAVRFAQSGGSGQVETPVCDPKVEKCPDAAEEGNIVVTGSRVQPKNASITNNQKAGVEEGDIVKQVGNFLLVLQDGRLFSVDLGRGAGGLRVADRVNIYRDPKSDTWYDEMLVTGDRVLITGYSYDLSATELSLFRVGETGRLESLGTFHMSSNDYYDSDNYATRIIGDRLIVYTPLALSEMHADRKLEWPIVRRWLPGEKLDEARGGRPLLDIRNVYKPVLETYQPVIHTVSVCPLGEADGRRELQCRSTGFVGPEGAEFYVSPTAAYLWTWPGWEDEQALRRGRGCPSSGFDYPGALYALPLDDEEEGPGVLGVRGAPLDHFSLETNRGEFRALIHTPVSPCDTSHDDDDDYDTKREKPLELSYFSVPLSRFGPRLADAGRRSYTRVPSPEGRYVANRFTDDYVVYGAIGQRSLWYLLGERDEDDEERPAIVGGTAFAVPVRRPEAVRRLPLAHNVIRAERSGNDVVLTGYRDPSGLDLSYIALAGEPRVASTVRLPGRYESEGRSHAFNAAVDEAGAGLMGLPTVTRPEGGGRWWWNSIASDVSFLSVDSAGRLADVGPLRSSAAVRAEDDYERESGVAGYSCEVSCVDWYGNSRPIFTGGRIFALTGTELVEGRVEAGRIREIGRLSIAGPTRPR